MNRIAPELSRKYFKKGSGLGFPIFFILIGIIITLAAFSDRHPAMPLVIIGGTCILLGIITMFTRKTSSITDSDIDNQFQNDVNEIAKMALNKLGLDESQITENRKRPLKLNGPILWPTNGINSKDLLWKKGKDGIVRFAVNRVTIIYFSEHLLGSYACDFNFLKNITLNESTNEFYYRDIVSVSTNETSSSYKLPNGIKLTSSKEFKLSLVNTESISVFIDSGKLTQMTQGKIPTEEAEKAVQVIRAILKEKKQ